MQWNRKLWGVHFNNGHEGIELISSLWNDETRDVPYIAEPTRALLFNDRAHARMWCARKNAIWRSYPEGNPVRSWKVHPVRVRETVMVEE